MNCDAKKDMIHYYYDKQRKIVLVFYKNAKLSYPIHTHAEHDTIGYVIDGEIAIVIDKETIVCEHGSSFNIAVDKPHAFRPNNEKSYTMVCTCMESDYLQNSDFEEVKSALEYLLKELPCNVKDIEKYRNELMNAIFMSKANQKGISILSNSYTKELKQKILQEPEEPLSIEQMSKSISVSSYHMIRQFKMDMGLTPHQFQIQSRVRKAQKLLEGGRSITEVAFESGFCDQSHFDRCFKKVVGITPNQYKKVVS